MNPDFTLIWPLSCLRMGTTSELFAERVLEPLPPRECPDERPQPNQHVRPHRGWRPARRHPGGQPVPGRRFPA